MKKYISQIVLSCVAVLVYILSTVAGVWSGATLAKKPVELPRDTIIYVACPNEKPRIIHYGTSLMWDRQDTRLIISERKVDSLGVVTEGISVYGGPPASNKCVISREKM